MVYSDISEFPEEYDEWGYIGDASEFEFIPINERVKFLTKIDKLPRNERKRRIFWQGYKDAKNQKERRTYWFKVDSQDRRSYNAGYTHWMKGPKNEASI